MPPLYQARKAMCSRLLYQQVHYYVTPKSKNRHIAILYQLIYWFGLYKCLSHNKIAPFHMMLLLWQGVVQVSLIGS